MSVADLDATRLGDLLVGLVCSSALLGHSTPRSTARWYFHPESPEEQFVYDVMTGRTDDIDAEWFNGRAAEVAVTLVDSARSEVRDQ